MVESKAQMDGASRYDSTAIVLIRCDLCCGTLHENVASRAQEKTLRVRTFM